MDGGSCPVLVVAGRSARSARPDPLPRLLVLVAVLLAPGPSRAGGNPPPTDCVHLCPDLGDPCAVTESVQVTPGSIINCGERLVDVDGTSGGELLIDDGRFTLRARTVKVRGQGQMAASCPGGTTHHGFRLEVKDDVILESGGKLRASCDTAGGLIAIEAGGDVTIGGNGIRADGTAADAPGGEIDITAGGDVVTSFEISAKATAGSAEGGDIGIDAGGALTIGAPACATTIQTRSARPTPTAPAPGCA